MTYGYTHDSDLSDDLIRERIRQSQRRFNLAYIMTATSAAIGLAGATLIYSGKVQAGTITAIGGIALGFYCLSLAKDANDRLDKLFNNLSTEKLNEINANFSEGDLPVKHDVEPLAVSHPRFSLLKSRENFWRRGNRMIVLASGGAFLGGIFAQAPGAIVGAIAGAVVGLLTKI